jgi:erythromycin esterase
MGAVRRTRSRRQRQPGTAGRGVPSIRNQSRVDRTACEVPDAPVLVARRRCRRSEQVTIVRALLIGVVLTTAACGPSGQPPQPLDFAHADLREQLAPLARAIDDSRIVLLGENGHGVGEFTDAKVAIVTWLHEHLGFDVVAFESGFFECAYAWERIEAATPAGTLFQCLRYPSQHAELLPLFERIHARRTSPHPLLLAGIDIQAQGFDSEARPAILHRALSVVHPGLAARVATLDTALFLLRQFGGLGDAVYLWAAEHEDSAIALYDSAAVAASGWERWSFRLAAGRVTRLAARGRAAAAGTATSRPPRYFELRDEWMAVAVSALADSIDGSRKLIVWMHNDHARYGDFSMSGEPHRSTGGYLRERYGDGVFSIGFFMGRGTIADNRRIERQIAVPDSGGIEAFLRLPGSAASYLVLRDNAAPSVRAWADRPRSYLRMGLEPMRLVPADEFDAMVYIDSVGPPDYEIR